ncbi:hypothetical protein [Brevibacillus sp. SKDU10]|uniref:hypothetical protein n=1 Tax=Brevibacillus sp. SKDU10 TaxID=1247872 RepID=UPI0012F8C6A1|nr:hypothetical protein [Brevibacillus sp. SKDU10]
MALKAIESQQPFTDGQRLRLSCHELSLRVISAERFLQTYPTSPKRNTVYPMYRAYLLCYIKGMPQSPAYDHNLGIF